MTAIDKIVFPVNFSEACKSATSYIADITNRFEAELRLLHVIGGKQSLAHRFAQKYEELKAFAGSLPNAMRWPRAVTQGDPAREIARYAKIHSADLIAMPIGGNEGRHRTSSTALGVLQNASCAVWTESGTGAAHARWSPILCAVDLKPGSEQTVRYAAGVAETLGAKLFVVHALSAPAEGLWTYPAELPAVVSKAEAHRMLESLIEGAGVYAEPLIGSGPVPDVLKHVAETIHAKLLVVGRGGDHQGMVGANTYELVRCAPCPVLSCPRPYSERGGEECFWTEWQLDVEPAYA